MRTPRTWSPWVITLAVLLLILFAGILLTVFAVAASSLTFDDLRDDLARAGVQIAVITFLGAVVTVTLKYVEERRRLNERRLQVFHEIILTYNRVKAVRRTIRTLGVVEPTRPLSAAQAQGLREQMSALNDAQLTLEALKRELNESDLFKNHREMWAQLRLAEDYLGKYVYGPWERIGGDIWEGATPAQLKRLDLVAFAGDKVRNPHFKAMVSSPLDDLTQELHEELFGARSRKTRMNR